MRIYRLAMILVLLATALLGVFHYGWGRTGCTDDPLVHGPRNCYFNSGD